MNFQFLIEDILNESKMDDLKATSGLSGPTFDAIHDNALPVKEKNATSMRWLVDRHNAGDEGITNPSNHPALQKSMTQHGLQKAKGTLPANQKNLNQFKSISHLHDAMKPHVDAADAAVEAKDKEIIFQNDTHIVRKHDSHESMKAAAKLSKENPNYAKCNGKATWCVSADNAGGATLHNQYTQSGKHPFYTIEHTGKHQTDPHRKYALLADPERTPERKNVEFRDEPQTNENNEDAIKDYIEENHSIMHTPAGKHLDALVGDHSNTLNPTEYRKTKRGEGQFVDWKKEGIHKKYHPALYGSPEIKSEGNWVNGKKHGIHTEYHSNSMISSIGNWVNGEKDGEHSEYDTDLSLLSRGNFVKGNREGTHVISNGYTTTTGEWKNNKEHGRHVTTHNNDSIHSDVMFENGNKVGRHDSYHRNGGIMDQGNWVNGKEDGLHQTYGANSELLKTGNWINGKEDGLHKEYNSDGVEMISGNWINGKEDGLHTRRDAASGSIIAQGNFVNGKKEGHHLEVITDADGNPSRVSKKYVDGVENGTRHTIMNYDENKTDISNLTQNEVRSTVNVVNGKKQGEEKSYSTIGDGTLTHTGHYKDDKKHGESNSLDSSGGVYRSMNYRDGMKHGKWFDNITNQSGHYKDDKKHGIQTSQHFGEITKTSFVNGERHGIESVSGVDGAIRSETYYKNNRKHGRENIYDTFSGNPRGTLIKYLTYKDGELEGDYADYHKSGRIALKGTYGGDGRRGGRIHGTVREYHDDDASSLASEANYTNGNLDGLKRRWHSNGQLAESGMWNGHSNAYLQKDGLHESWNHKGDLIEHTNWQDGEKHGLHLHKFADGSIMKKGEWKNDTPVGNHISNSWDGLPLYNKTFDDHGNMHGVQSEWREGGLKKSVNNYKNGKRHGKFVIYHNDESNHPQRIVNYENDELHGKSSAFDKDGRVRWEGDFAHGREVGVHYEYHPSGNLSSKTDYDSASHPQVEEYQDSDNIKKPANKFKKIVERGQQ